MRTILFIDGTCPKPYDLNTLESEGLGGTEATVVRVAEGLASHEDNFVIVEQHNINDSIGNSGLVEYRPIGMTTKATNVVCLRHPGLLIEARNRFPHANLYLWCHDLATREFALIQGIVRDTKATMLCVSQFHKTQTIEALIKLGFNGEFPVKTVYNPVDDSLKPDGTYVDPFKLIWFSSPHKGLTHALNLFKAIKNYDDKYAFFIANPGYYRTSEYNNSGIVNLGIMPHKDIIKEVRSSLCVFYPNTVFAETFGLVFAEANAVGTPVLTHQLGAAGEVLDHPSEIIDCKDVEKVIKRLSLWSSGSRPIVRVKPQFRLTEVLKEWMRLLTS